MQAVTLAPSENTPFPAYPGKKEYDDASPVQKLGTKQLLFAFAKYSMVIPPVKDFVYRSRLSRKNQAWDERTAYSLCHLERNEVESRDLRTSVRYQVELVRRSLDSLRSLGMTNKKERHSRSFSVSEITQPAGTELPRLRRWCSRGAAAGWMRGPWDRQGRSGQP